MLSHFKRSLDRAIVLLLLFPASAAFGTHHRKANPRAGHKPGAVVHRARSHSVAGATMVLLGDTAVEWQYDSLLAGQAEAFRLQAGTSGLARTVHVYVSARSAAGTLIAGLYSSAAGHPDALLSTGSTSAPQPSAWTAVSIAPVELVSGRIYWLAILGRDGRLRYRDRARGPCQSKTSAKRDLHALPTSWRTGRTYSDCPVSAYASAAPLSPPAGSSPLTSKLSEQPELPEQTVAPPPGAPVTPPPEQPVAPAPGPPAATAPPTISGNT